MGERSIICKPQRDKRGFWTFFSVPDRDLKFKHSYDPNEISKTDDELLRSIEEDHDKWAFIVVSHDSKIKNIESVRAGTETLQRRNDCFYANFTTHYGYKLLGDNIKIERRESMVSFNRREGVDKYKQDFFYKMIEDPKCHSVIGIDGGACSGKNFLLKHCIPNVEDPHVMVVDHYSRNLDFAEEVLEKKKKVDLYLVRCSLQDVGERHLEREVRTMGGQLQKARRFLDDIVQRHSVKECLFLGDYRMYTPENCIDKDNVKLCIIWNPRTKQEIDGKVDGDAKSAVEFYYGKAGIDKFLAEKPSLLEMDRSEMLDQVRAGVQRSYERNRDKPGFTQRMFSHVMADKPPSRGLGR